jgi:hypothetical protein
MLNDDVAIVPDITGDDRVPLEAYRPTFVKSLVMVPVGTQKPLRAIGGVLGPCAQTDGTTDSDAARPRA